MLQAIVDWFANNPPALTALATLLGGLMAALVAVLTSWMSHHFTAKREAAKATADEQREQSKAEREARSARRAVLRAHLERMVACVQQHVSVHKTRALESIQHAASPSGEKGGSDTKPSTTVAVGALEEAAAIALLYCPELDPAIDALRRGTVVLFTFLVRNCQDLPACFPRMRAARRTRKPRPWPSPAARYAMRSASC
jgi:hypothetical protein